jgi:DNA polymerase
VDAKRARYLKLQAELGGSEVILAAPLTAADSASPAPSPAPDSSAPTVPSGDPSDVPRWLKDAPPIPEQGLVIASPDGTPLGHAGGSWADLAAVAGAVHHCAKCPLCQERKHTVPGEGHPTARLMLVGEGPGATEDATGRPFVGRAGDLLTTILASIDLTRDEVFIANVVKCRPPSNRKPLPEEVAACLPYLERQVSLIRPKVMLALGGTAAEALLGVRRSLGQLRERVHSYHGIPLVVTYHPAALLRNPHWKKPTWDDVRIARQLLER